MSNVVSANTPTQQPVETWGYHGGPHDAAPSDTLTGASTSQSAGIKPQGWFPWPGAGGNDTSTSIDGNANNSGGRTWTQTTDGKQVAVDPFQGDTNVSIQRERTIAGSGNQQYISSDQLVFTTQSADDDIQVQRNDDGSLGVSVNGDDYAVDMADGQQLTFRTGAGNDTITVASDVKVNVVIDSGAGDDTVNTGAGDATIRSGDGNDVVQTGSGSNYVEAGNGDDQVTGGSGYNVIYGGDGIDQLRGGNGGNYISGGMDDDNIQGGTGENILSGGRGNDSIDSGGSSHIYAGSGDDVVAGSATDTIYAEAGDDTSRAAGANVVNVVIDPSLGTKGLKVEGSEAFQQRVNADIELLRSSPDGQQMLAAYDAAADNGNTVTIRELQNEGNGYTMPAETGNNWADTQLHSDGQAGRGDDAVIRYNASFRIPEFPVPVGVLYHEMSHAYNAVTGTFQPGTYTGPDSQDANAGVPNSERQAVGLDNTGIAHDFDGDPSTPMTTANPFALTENGLRAEMGLDPRLHYAL